MPILRSPIIIVCLRVKRRPNYAVRLRLGARAGLISRHFLPFLPPISSSHLCSRDLNDEDRRRFGFLSFLLSSASYSIQPKTPKEQKSRQNTVGSPPPLSLRGRQKRGFEYARGRRNDEKKGREYYYIFPADAAPSSFLAKNEHFLNESEALG